MCYRSLLLIHLGRKIYEYLYLFGLRDFRIFGIFVSVPFMSYELFNCILCPLPQNRSSQETRIVYAKAEDERIQTYSSNLLSTHLTTTLEALRNV